MSVRIDTRSWGKRAAALAAAAGTIATGAVVLAGNASALTPLVTVKAVSVHHVAALTGNQVVTITGTGFDEANIAQVDISGCTSHMSYVVQNATTLLAKTPADCAASGSSTVSETVSIVDTQSSPQTATFVGTATTGILFIAKPLLTDSDTHTPVYTTNGGTATVAGPLTAGTNITVVAGSGTKFVSTASYPLTASLGGVPLSGIKVVGSANGNSFTGTLGAYTAAQATPALKVTNNGVTATFAFHAAETGCVAGTSCTYATHTFTIAAKEFVKVTPALVPLAGATITVAGTGFPTASGSTPTVTVGSQSCGTVTVVSSTKLTCVAPAQAAGAYPVDVSFGSTSTADNGTNYVVYSAY